jgi:capsular exopolysaccharide synthesis family protein
LTILVSTDRPWDEFICNAGIENLDVMPAGPSPDNPLSILSSEKMARLLRGWTELYDYILIDTPPILGIADAQSLVSRVDTTIFISGIGVATKSDMRRAMELVEATPKKFLGVVVNLLKNTEDDYLIYTSQLNSIEELSENLDNGNVNRSSYRGENNTSNLRQR